MWVTTAVCWNAEMIAGINRNRTGMHRNTAGIIRNPKNEAAPGSDAQGRSSFRGASRDQQLPAEWTRTLCVSEAFRPSTSEATTLSTNEVPVAEDEPVQVSPLAVPDALPLVMLHV
jgi:hypothetical protein